MHCGLYLRAASMAAARCRVGQPMVLEACTPPCKIISGPESGGGGAPRISSNILSETRRRTLEHVKNGIECTIVTHARSLPHFGSLTWSALEAPL
eukprot:2538630-Prymnesium_polylepis.1